MDIGAKTKTIATIAMDYGKEVNWSLEQLNHIYGLANYDVLKKKYGFPRDLGRAENDQQISDSLKFLVTSASITLTAGTGNLPSNYYHKIGVKSNTGKKVDILNGYEDIEREDNIITIASTRHQTCQLFASTIQVKPTTILSVTMVYYRKPTTPVYAVTTTNGIPVYSAAGSTQFEWGEEHDIDIIRYVLEYMGITVSNETILPYVQNKKIEEN